MTTLFLATTGGHLAQLDSIARRIGPEEDSLWVTHENEQSMSLLAGRITEFVPYVGGKGVRDVIACLPSAHRVWHRHRITRAVSTGSAIALGYLPYLAARGVECHYVESAARVRGPSLTGRLLRWVPGIHRYTQYPHWSDRHWRYGGSTFDCFEAAPPRPFTSGRIRVVVTVGTAAEFPFRRMLNALVPLLAADGALARETGAEIDVLWQTGCTPVGGLGITARPFLPAAELDTELSRADLVISHAGAGLALASLSAGRAPLLLTRQAIHGEAGDDHQGELAAELTSRGLAAHACPDSVTGADVCDRLGAAVRSVAALPRFELAS